MARSDAASSGIARTESSGRVLTSIRGWFAVFAAAILALAACRATAMVVMQHKAGTSSAPGPGPSPPPAAALPSSSNASDVLHCRDTRGNSTISPTASRLSQKTMLPAVLRAQPDAAAAAAGPAPHGRLLLQAQPRATGGGSALPGSPCSTSSSAPSQCTSEQGSPPLACVPQDVNASGSSGTGICVLAPQGGVAVPPQLAPSAYWPLTNSSLARWPDGGQAGSAIRGPVVWVDDDTFGSVMYCRKDPSSPGQVILNPPTTIGRAGTFAINLWLRRPQPGTWQPLGPSPAGTSETGVSGTGAAVVGNYSDAAPFEYLLSWASGSALMAPTWTGFSSSQVNLYTPAPDQPLYGLVRAILKDSNDNASASYLDSDGAVADNTRAQPAPGATNVSDAAWHMVTLTTRAEGGKGYQLYIDGQLAASLPPANASTPTSTSTSTSTSASASDTSTATTADLLSLLMPDGTSVDGGDPLLLDQPLRLCGRADGDPSRSYEGALAQLALFDRPLGSVDVQALYRRVVNGTSAAGTTISPQQATQPATRSTSGIANMTAAAAANRSAAAEPLYNAPAGTPCSMRPRTVASRMDVFCAPGLVCGPAPAPAEAPPSSPTARSIPLAGDVTIPTGSASGDPAPYPPRQQQADTPDPSSATDPSEELSEAYDFSTGSCAVPLPGVLLPATWPAAWPPPLAYFPLTAGSLASWPGGQYRGRNRGAQWLLDTRFGSVLTCNKAWRSYVTLPPVPYGATGGFALNIWIKLAPGALEGGGNYSYVLAQSGDDDKEFGVGPNHARLQPMAWRDAGKATSSQSQQGIASACVTCGR